MAENEAEGGGETTEVAAQPKSKFKLIVMIVGVLAVLGGGAAGYFLFFRGGHDKEEHAEVKVKPAVFVDVPDMLVNLTGNPGERVQYLKVKVVLELKEEKQIEEIKPTMPRVTDIFQTYLRELRPADLNGSAGPFRPQGGL